nr:glycosyl hydrolase family 28-related protein [Paenibacillus hemerocallicola]
MPWEVNILDYGAVGDGSVDDTNAFRLALSSGAGSIRVPTGYYKITSKLYIPEFVTMRGIGRMSKILKGFNGDMIEMGTDSKLIEIELDGKGATFSGRGVIINSGHNQKIMDCTIVNTMSYCVEYTTSSAGIISTIEDSLLYTISRTFPAVKYPDNEANGDRKLISVDCGGGVLADFAGCSTILVAHCNTIGVVFRPASKKVSLVGNRIAGGTAGLNVEVHGINHAIVGNISATPIIVKSDTSGSSVVGNSATIIDETGGTNNIDIKQKGVSVIDNYGMIHSDSSLLQVGAGGKSPDAASISFGDGTGWKLNVGTKRNGAFAAKFSFYDKGCLYFEPMKDFHAANGTLFVDSADNKLKFKDAAGAVRNLY